jgi:hypothetical protein
MAIPLALLGVLAALGLAAVALWLVTPLRRRVDQLSDDVNSLQVALNDLRSELADLRAAAVVPGPPPLPRTRSGGLDDLRQRLRAAHSESDEAPEE